MKGIIYGLNTDSHSEESLALLYLASIQAITYLTKHILKVIGNPKLDTLLLCGGGTKNPILLQQLADICQCKIFVAADGTDCTLLGGAILGAVSSGHYSSIIEAMHHMALEYSTWMPYSAMIDKNDSVLYLQKYHACKYKVFLKLYEDQAEYRNMMNTVDNL